MKRALRLAFAREDSERQAVLDAALRGARGVRVARGRPEKVLTRSEVERLCRGMSARGALFVRFLFATGCRVSEMIGAHSLRHSAATALIRGGSGVQAVGEYLGHADPATTLRFYVHQAVSDAELDAPELWERGEA